MREALLCGQRQMLHGEDEGVGIVGFECWKGVDEIRAVDDLYLKANRLAIYKVRLIDCYVTTHVPYRPCLSSKEDILFNAEFTCRGGRTLKILWYRYVRSIFSGGACQAARSNREVAQPAASVADPTRNRKKCKKRTQIVKRGWGPLHIVSVASLMGERWTWRKDQEEGRERSGRKNQTGGEAPSGGEEQPEGKEQSGAKEETGGGGMKGMR